MPSPSVQFQFAAEFATFLVSAAGLAVIVLRSELLSRSRLGALALGAGFCGEGAAALLHGSLLVQRGTDPAVVGLRVIGLALLVAGSWRWDAGRVARRLLWLGLVLLAVAIALGAAVGPADLASTGLLGISALALGAMLVRASRRAIAARVVSSAAAALLLLVLILSVALSEVLSSTVRDDAVRRLDTRAVSEAANATAVTQGLIASAWQTRALLEGYCSGEEAAICIQAYLPQVSSDFFPLSSGLGRVFIASGGYMVGESPTLAPGGSLGFSVARGLAGSQVVKRAISTQTETATEAVVDRRPLAVVAEPTVINQVSGASVVVQELDGNYLDGRRQDDPSLSLALADAHGILSHGGALVGQRSLGPLVGPVLDGSTKQASGMVGGRFVAVQPVSLTGGSRPVMALVASTPTVVVDETQASLFRTLFLIALGGTVLALLFTAFVGDRIGAGLRRLTTAVDAVQRGDPEVRVGFISDDEVGVLGGAFDFMAASIEDKEAALRQAARDEARLRDRLEAIVAGMGEALIAVDADGLITDFNAAAEALVGTKAAAAVGRPVDQVILMRADDRSASDQPLGEVPANRWTAQGWVDRPDGEAVPVSVSAGPLRGSASKPAGGVYVVRDQRREREVERMKTEFLSRIGHELRTPLTAIMGFTELLSRRRVDVEQATAWQAEILVQSKRLLRTVEMLEFFASTGSGGFNLNLEPVDLRAVINDLLERWNERLPNGQVVVQRLGRQLPTLLADRRWLALALDELVDNAVKFSPGGGKVVTRASQADGMVEISVSDKGKGMSAEEAGRVFGEFAQGDASDTRQHGGLGLGLSMVQRVAVSHGGHLSFQSRPGRGSRFSIVLPVAGGDAGEAGRRQDAAGATTGSSEGSRPGREAS